MRARWTNYPVLCIKRNCHKVWPNGCTKARLPRSSDIFAIPIGTSTSRSSSLNATQRDVTALTTFWTLWAIERCRLANRSCGANWASFTSDPWRSIHVYGYSCLFTRQRCVHHRARKIHIVLPHGRAFGTRTQRSRNTVSCFLWPAFPQLWLWIVWLCLQTHFAVSVANGLTYLVLGKQNTQQRKVRHTPQLGLDTRWCCQLGACMKVRGK